MLRKHYIAKVAILLVFLMNFPAFADTGGSVVIGEAPGARVTSNVKKTEGDGSEDLSNRQVEIKSTEVASEPAKASQKEEVRVVLETAKPSEAAPVAATKVSESTKAETTKAETTKSETPKMETTKVETSTEEEAKPAAIRSDATFRPVRSAIISSSNEVGPGVKPTKPAETAPVESEFDKLRREMVDFALKHVGLKYRWGGASLAKGVDCSGLTSEVYRKFGISIGRTSRDQAVRGKNVPMDQIKPGDLLIYTDYKGYINHVTMYIGNGKLINASSENTGVIISDIGYRTPLKAIRFIQD